MTNYAHQQSKGNKHNCVLLFNTTLPRSLKSQERGGGGGAWIPIEGDDRMGAKTNPPPKKKIPRAFNKTTNGPEINTPQEPIQCRISEPQKFPESMN